MESTEMAIIPLCGISAYVPSCGVQLMKTQIRILLGLIMLGGLFAVSAERDPLAGQEKKSLRARLKKALKGQQVWTVDDAMSQLRLYPKDVYLQYVVLQLARRENRLNEI